MSSDNPNRRSVLKLATGSIIAPKVIGSVSGNNSDNVEIVTAKYDGEAIKTREVPKGWHKRLNKAREGQNILKKRFSEKSWFVSAGRKAGEEVVENFKKHNLKLGVTDKSEIEEPIPERISGVPVDVEEEETPEKELCTDICSCVQGGSTVVTDHGAGSLCCTVEHPDYNKLGILTCSHIFKGDKCCEDITGTEVNCDGTFIGYIQEFDNNEDWAFAPEADWSDVSGLSNKIVSSDYPVKGHVTKDGIDSMISNNTTMYQYGMSSCLSSGEISEFKEYSTCAAENCAEMVEDVETTIDTETGNSGGVHYREYDMLEVASIIGVHVSHKTCFGAYKINNQYGIEFTNDSSC